MGHMRTDLVIESGEQYVRTKTCLHIKYEHYEQVHRKQSRHSNVNGNQPFSDLTLRESFTLHHPGKQKITKLQIVVFFPAPLDFSFSPTDVLPLYSDYWVMVLTEQTKMMTLLKLEQVLALQPSATTNLYLSFNTCQMPYMYYFLS